MNLSSSPNRALSRLALLCITSLFASHDAVARPKLESTCPGGMPIDFVRACDKHANKGYVPLRRQLSDGSCMNMCCQQDANGNMSCVSDPNQIVGRNRASSSAAQPGMTTLAPPSKAPSAKPAAAATPGVLPNSK